ncbi:MAG: MBL fold metallo-hydrolase, partial [Xanthomonadales bacterium]|nr:MBL fold metallo-hydrolase [Xanthomonadales bacterium]
VTTADVLLLESTYGDREHRSMEETLEQLEAIIDEASANGGNILIPSFAVGRTQEIIFRLGELYQKGKLRQQRVFLDSPMAIATTRVYSHFQHVYNAEDINAIRQGETGTLSTFLPTLRFSETTEESMALNRIEAGAIFIAGSGMCNGGRIRHHLKHNLWRRNAHVLIIGYQAFGTPGRALVDGAETFNVAGEKVAVKATIHTLGGFSAHAGQSQLLEWALQFNEPRPRLYLVHGDADAKMALSTRFQNQGWRANIPEHGESLSF